MKDFLYEKIKAEHWKERALIADARIAALEAALRFYADTSHYAGTVISDCGQIARAALPPEQDK